MKNLLLYGGLEKEDFKSLLADAWKRNQRDVKTYSLLAFIIFVALAIANAAVGDMTSINQKYYIAMALFNGAVQLCVRFVLPKRPALTRVVVYAFMIALYAFAIGLTTLHRDMPAVAMNVLLFAVPFLMTDRPVRVVGLTVLVTAAMCTVSACVKPPEIARMDLWNGVTFAVVAIVVEVLQQRARFHAIAQGRKVRYLSETDLLTGAKNRNRYENRQQYYAENCRENLTCVYVDVNGLHELNDTKGHVAGDEMLEAVGHSLIECFGVDHTYRIGGDEFVCFRMDAAQAQVRGDMAAIADGLRAKGYNISVGVATGEKEALDVPALIISAEDEMYRAKRAYYERTGKDRRRR